MTTEHATRYIVGIDLGTTNCAMSWVDTSLPPESCRVEIFQIPQIIAPGEVEARPTLPSFVYLPEPGEMDGALLRLPWSQATPDCCVGAYARDCASRLPSKVVASAKSWLCCESVDRRADILPFDRNEVPRQISPVAAARLLIEHMRDAWNHAMTAGNKGFRLERQDVFLTVPASFDAVARELTVEAAEAAGLSVRLLEEPQAAFYAWLHEKGDAWREYLTADDRILVCDIGGGTTDFSLIEVTDEEGNLGLERVAVGEHILLGGDNMDLALAYGVAERLKRERGLALDGWQLAALTHACRAAKEALAGEGVASHKLTILGRGTSVIGGTISAELAREDVQTILLEGFLPICAYADVPAERRKAAFRAFGLDYASDPAVTRHLAAFLRRHMPTDAGGDPRPLSCVLFNGGVTKSPLVRERIMRALGTWSEFSSVTTTVLTDDNPDLAVAIGAAWYGFVRRVGGVRIKAGSARSYYIGIESSLPAVPGFEAPVEALCVVNFGMEEGTSVEVPAKRLGLIVGEPTAFRVFSSTRRPEDAVGDLLPDCGGRDLEELPPIQADLGAEDRASPIGSMVAVTLSAELTEIGTLQLWCSEVKGEGRWRLEFQIRDDA